VVGGGGGGEGEEEVGEVEEDESRTRREEMIESSASSYGKENSLRKYGCKDRLSDGEGESTVLGVECAEPGDSNPSASCILNKRRRKKRSIRSSSGGMFLSDDELVANVRGSLALRCCSNFGFSPIYRQWSRTGLCLGGWPCALTRRGSGDGGRSGARALWTGRRTFLPRRCRETV
jgi:hypothetical protein